MNLFEDTNPRPLKELLSQIHSKEASLPDFQRDFVWDPSATQELIVSIANNYPAGSLLRVRNTKGLFAYREFEGAPPLNGSKTTYLFLDGQQRLTSLYQAFFGVGDHRYFVDLKKLQAGDDFEDAIFNLRTKHPRAKQLEDVEVQARELVLPLSVLKGGAGNYSKWSSAVRKKTEAKKRDELEDRLSEIGENWIQAIDDYQFPVVTLSDKTDAVAICTIFETLNRTGVKLSPFELLTARFWPENLSLRQLWTKSIEKHPIISDFDIDPYYVLQVIGLAARKTPSCKRKDVLALDVKTVKDWWPRAVDAMAVGLKMLRDDCGVLLPQWLPYNAIVIPLAGAIAKAEATKGPKVGANRTRLVRWFWCSVLSQAYDNAQNSQSAKDVSELLEWFSGGQPPASIRQFKFNPALLEETTQRQRALYRGVMCLIVSNGPRDFHNANRLTPTSIVEEHVDDHHIFPQNYLGKGVQSRLKDSILNRTLIDRKTNIRISDRAPSDYLSEIKNELKKVKQSAFGDVLQSHLLPDDPKGPLMQDEFENFLEWRRDAIAERVAQVTTSD